MTEKEKHAGLTTIKDELEELTFLIEPNIFISEYIPFGSNHIIAFNDELDSLGAVEGGLLTSIIDKEPQKCTFRITEDPTLVKVHRFDPNDFIQFEANIPFENVGGIQQVEDFGIHVDSSGRVIYGCSILEIVGKRDKHSLDNISRVIADLVSDSSRLMNNLLTTYQRHLLELVYFGEPLSRNKFFIVTAREIDPEMDTTTYLEEAAYHNELNQIIKQAYYGKDLLGGGKCFYGSEGLLLITKNLDQYEEILAIIGFFQGLDIFQRNYFSKMFMLWDEVRDARDLVDKVADPNAIGEAQVILSRVSAAVVLMAELLQFMQAAFTNISFEFQELQPLNEAQEELAEFVQLRDSLKKATTRIEDASLIVKGLKDEIEGVHGLIASLSERQMRQMNEALKDSITSMDEMTRSSERTGVALNVLQIVLSGSVAFSVLALFVGEYKWVPLADWLSEGSVWDILIWVGLSMGFFFLTGFGILKLIKRLEAKSEPNLRAVLKLGAIYHPENFEKYIASKSIKHQRRTSRIGHTILEYTWDDHDSAKWLGNEANVIFYVDMTNHIILSVTVNIDSPKAITTKETSEIMLTELVNAGVVPKTILQFIQ